MLSACLPSAFSRMAWPQTASFGDMRHTACLTSALGHITSERPLTLPDCYSLAAILCNIRLNHPLSLLHCLLKIWRSCMPHKQANTVNRLTHNIQLKLLNVLQQRRRHDYVRAMTVGMSRAQVCLFVVKSAAASYILWLSVLVLALAEKLQKWNV